MLVCEVHCGSAAGGEAEEVDLAQAELVDQQVRVLYDVLGLELFVREAAGAAAAAAEVEEYDVVVAGQGFEAGE